MKKDDRLNSQSLEASQQAGQTNSLSPSAIHGRYAKNLSEMENRIKKVEEISGIYNDESKGIVILVGRESHSQVDIPLTLEDVALILRLRLTKFQTQHYAHHFGCAFDPVDNEMYVRYFGGIEDTHLGFILYNADLALKQYWMGVRSGGEILQSSVSGYHDVLQRLRQDAFANNFSFFRSWFESRPVLQVSTNQQIAILEKTGIFVAYEEMNWRNGKYVPSVLTRPLPKSHRAFADFFTKRLNEFTQEESALAALVRIVQVTALLSRLTKIDKIEWIEEYAGKKYATPTKIQPIQVRLEGRRKMEKGGLASYTIHMSGGVSIAINPNPDIHIADDDKIIDIETHIKEKVPSVKTGSVFTFRSSGIDYVGIVLHAL